MEKRGRKLILVLFLILIIPFLTASPFGYDTDETSTVTVNSFTGNLTNLSEMQDVNIPSPSNNEVLTFNSGNSLWESASAQAVGDTNETARFDNLTAIDCSGGFVVNGVFDNGTVSCIADADSGAINIFDQVLNTTSNVTFNNINVSDVVESNLNPSTDSTFNFGTTILRWLNGFFDNLVVGIGNFTEINSEDWTNVSITESQISDFQNYILTSNEANLNVNSSNFWDGLDVPSDINAADITDDGTYLLATGDTATGNYTFSDNITANYFFGNGSQLTDITLTESDPLAYNGTLVDETRLNNGTYIIDLVLNNGSYLNIPETDPFWDANYTNLLTECGVNFYAFGIFENGTFQCRADLTSSGGNTTEEIQDAVGSGFGDGLDYDDTNGFFNHSDFTSVANSTNSGNTFIQDITFDNIGLGHIVTIVTAVVDILTTLEGFFDQDLNTTSNVTFFNVTVNNLTADFIFGNGSQLTDITLAESDPLAYNGTLVDETRLNNGTYIINSVLNNGTYVTNLVLNNGSYFDTDTWVANFSNQIADDCGSDFVTGIFDNGTFRCAVSSASDATWLSNFTAYNTTWSTDTIDTTWLVNWTAYNTTWSIDTDTFVANFSDFENKVFWGDVNNGTIIGSGNTTEEIQDAVGSGFGDGLTYDDANGFFNHSETGAAANSTNSGNTFIQSIGFDKFGHVLSLVTGIVDIITSVEGFFDQEEELNQTGNPNFNSIDLIDSLNVTAGNVSATGRIILALSSCSDMQSGEICKNATGVFIQG